jgi:hypothetical protein
VRGVATGDMGVARDGTHKPRLSARDGTPRPLHPLRRGRAGQSDQGTKRACSTCAADCQSAGVRPRDQGACGTYRCRPSMCWAGSSTRRAGRSTDALGGGFLYHQATMARSRSGSSSRWITRTHICRRSRNSSAGNCTRQSAPISKAAARQLRLARDQRGWLASGSEARFPRRRADRLRGRLRERAADQGQRTRRSNRRCSRRKPRPKRSALTDVPRHAGQLSSPRWSSSWIADRAEEGAQRPAGAGQIRPAVGTMYGQPSTCGCN